VEAQQVATAHVADRPTIGVIGGHAALNASTTSKPMERIGPSTKVESNAMPNDCMTNMICLSSTNDSARIIDGFGTCPVSPHKGQQELLAARQSEPRIEQTVSHYAPNHVARIVNGRRRPSAARA
jgi:hypothetical protein